MLRYVRRCRGPGGQVSGAELLAFASADGVGGHVEVLALPLLPLPHRASAAHRPSGEVEAAERFFHFLTLRSIARCSGDASYPPGTSECSAGARVTPGRDELVECLQLGCFKLCRGGKRVDDGLRGAWAVPRQAWLLPIRAPRIRRRAASRRRRAVAARRPRRGLERWPKDPRPCQYGWASIPPTALLGSTVSPFTYDLTYVTVATCNPCLAEAGTPRRGWL